MQNNIASGFGGLYNVKILFICSIIRGAILTQFRSCSEDDLRVLKQCLDSGHQQYALTITAKLSMIVVDTNVAIITSLSRVSKMCIHEYQWQQIATAPKP